MGILMELTSTLFFCTCFVFFIAILRVLNTCSVRYSLLSPFRCLFSAEPVKIWVFDACSVRKSSKQEFSG